MSLSVDIKISDFHRAVSWAVGIYVHVGDIEQRVAAAAVTVTRGDRQHCFSCGGDGGDSIVSAAAETGATASFQLRRRREATASFQLCW